MSVPVESHIPPCGAFWQRSLVAWLGEEPLARDGGEIVEDLDLAAGPVARASVPRAQRSSDMTVAVDQRNTGVGQYPFLDRWMVRQ